MITSCVHPILRHAERLARQVEFILQEVVGTEHLWAGESHHGRDGRVLVVGERLGPLMIPFSIKQKESGYLNQVAMRVIIVFLLLGRFCSSFRHGSEASLLVVGIVLFSVIVIVFTLPYDALDPPLLIIGVVVRDIQLHLVLFVLVFAPIVALGDEPPLLVIVFFRLLNLSELAIQERGANTIRIADLIPLSVVLVLPFAAMHGCVPFTPFLVKDLIHPQGDASLVIVFNSFASRCHIFLLQGIGAHSRDSSFLIIGIDPLFCIRPFTIPLAIEQLFHQSSLFIVMEHKL